MVGSERLRRLSEHLRGGASARASERAVPAAAAELRAAPAAAQSSEELAPKLLPGEPELSHAEAHRRSLELLSSAAQPEEGLAHTANATTALYAAVSNATMRSVDGAR